LAGRSDAIAPAAAPESRHRRTIAACRSLRTKRTRQVKFEERRGRCYDDTSPLVLPMLICHGAQRGDPGPHRGVRCKQLRPEPFFEINRTPERIGDAQM